jgi:hypothetical protein
MTGIAMRSPRSLALPLSGSVLLHVLAIVALVFVRTSGRQIRMPEPYSLHLVAAAPGERALGVVNPPRPAATETPPPPKVQTKAPAPAARRQPATKTPRATQTTAKAPPKSVEQTKAAGGAEGGRGTDVANVNVQGKEFPFPAYLDNIANQIMSRFHGRYPEAFTAEVSFLIRSDGSATTPRIVNSNGSYEFKTEALAAVEAAGRTKAFGPLPDGFAGDVLPVLFTFDGRVIR